MQIDWFTVIAQVINFLVLVWLLKRFLYAPVMRAMAKREAGIAERLREAERREAKAAAEAARHAELQTQLKSEREAVLDQARKDADAERNTLHEQARRDMEAQRERWQADLAREQTMLNHALRERGARRVLATTRHVLDQLAGTTLERQLVGRFIEQLQGLPEAGREPMREALASAGKARIETSLPLDQTQRDAIAAALDTYFGGTPELLFETTDRFGCGIELLAGGRRLSWTLDHALHEMDEALGDALRTTAREGQ